MASQMRSRYEIGCSECGVICYETTLKKALIEAQTQTKQHDTDSEKVTVYDRLAHYGKPELFDTTGKVLKLKGVGF